MKHCILSPCVLFAAITGISCTEEAQEKSKDPEVQSPAVNAQAKPESLPAAEPPANPAEDLGQAKAKANEKAAVIAFQVRTAVVSNAYDKFAISLSDVADDPVDDLGQFPPSKDDALVYHRIVLKFEQAPTAAGQFPVKGLLFSARDQDLHFNFGWSGDSVGGTVTIVKMAGELPAGSHGVKARPESVEGTFEVTNKYGGVFTGEFKAAGIPQTE